MGNNRQGSRGDHPVEGHIGDVGDAGDAGDRPRAARRRQTGFGLPETLVVLALVGVLLGMAVPGMAQWRARTELRMAAQAWWASALLARSQALQRQQRVVICPVWGADACDPQGRWTQGWLVFVDVNRNGTRQADEPLLQAQPAWPQGLRVGDNLATVVAVGYAPDGRSQSPGGGFQAGTLGVCSRHADHSWKVVINMLGRPRLEQVAHSACD